MQVGYEARGTGPVVLLLHSSVSGCRQWRPLTALIEDRFRAVAVDLIGYGDTPGWEADRPQELADQVAAVLAVAEQVGRPVAIVGHSFGGSVAIGTAAALGDRLPRLILLEPNPFAIIQESEPAAYAEAAGLRDTVQTCGARGAWDEAAARFADYWNGAGSWASMTPDRREVFARALRPNYHEWDAVMCAPTSREVAAVTAWTDVIAASDTTRSIAAVVRTLERLRPDWRFTWIDSGGHMAPISRGDVINPLVAAALDASRTDPSAAR
jgi:pimeloyl-ACP methyl ester carboxylesterase